METTAKFSSKLLVDGIPELVKLQQKVMEGLEFMKENFSAEEAKERAAEHIEHCIDMWNIGKHEQNTLGLWITDEGATIYSHTPRQSVLDIKIEKIPVWEFDANSVTVKFKTVLHEISGVSNRAAAIQLDRCIMNGLQHIKETEAPQKAAEQVCKLVGDCINVWNAAHDVKLKILVTDGALLINTDTANLKESQTLLEVKFTPEFVEAPTVVERPLATDTFKVSELPNTGLILSPTPFPNTAPEGVAYYEIVEFGNLYSFRLIYCGIVGVALASCDTKELCVERIIDHIIASELVYKGLAKEDIAHITHPFNRKTVLETTYIIDSTI